MKVAVIGNGAMGSGIAQAFAQCADIEKTFLCGRNPERIEKAYNKIIGGIEKRVARGKADQSLLDGVKDRLEWGLMDDLAGEADLIVESISEEMDVKLTVLTHLMNDVNTKEDTIWSTNTSSLSITEISAGLPKPVVGLHFFNPAPVMKLIEIASGLTTPADYVDKMVEIAKTIGKVPVKVSESPGFVVNRILIPYINEGIFCLQEGVSDVAGIDTCMKLGANHPMGPLALGDLVGLDVCLAIMNTLEEETGDPKYRVPSLMKQMVRAGKLGMKSGEGFYKYGGPDGPVPNDIF